MVLRRPVYYIALLATFFPGCFDQKIDDPSHVAMTQKLMKKGRLLFENEDYFEALLTYKNSLKYRAIPNENKSQIYANIGATQFTIGRYEEAIDSLKQALMFSHVSANALSRHHLLLGSVYYIKHISTGNSSYLDQAIDHYRDSITLNPENKRAKTELNKANLIKNKK